MMKSYAPKTMAELPASLAALTLESKIVGGGTDFVIRLHSGAVQPDALCYLGHIPELKKIEKQGDTISVGAYCTMTQMEHDPIVREYLPALMDAAADVGSLQIRNNGTIGGNLGTAVFLAVVNLLTLLIFAWAIRKAVPQVCPGAALLWSLAANLCQAVWMPNGGYWYFGAITGTIYHNTTYIMLQPLALIAFFLFLSLAEHHGQLQWRSWAALTVLLTVATAIKPSYLFAFAPALLVALVVDLIRTHGKALQWEVWLGCTVLPGILLCIIQAKVLFTGGDDSGMALIFTTDFDPEKVLWGVFNYSAKHGLVRSLVFVGAVVLLLFRQWRGAYAYKFSLLLFAVSLAEALLLVESGERLYHANLWWGPFICFWVFWLESVSVFLQQTRTGAVPRWRLAVCAAALAWHIVSGVCFLVMLLQGVSYNVPILTYNLW